MDSRNRLDYIVHCLVEYRKWWILPAIMGLVLATIYAFFIQGETWTSRQTMIIRDDLLGESFKPGSFLSEEAMKSAQETVLETARRPEVIRQALETLGPETKSFLGFGGVIGQWPSDKMVEDYRDSVSFESANGGEFGKSEVIVLAAKGSSAQRSVAFLEILLDEVDEKLSEIRADRFESMEAEVRATCESTLDSRAALEAELMQMEQDFGTDISLVRSMNERAAGSPSAFENEHNEILRARRIADSTLAQKRSIRQGLVDAARSSSGDMPTSAELLASQRGLSEMVNALAKAQQDLSQAEAKFQPAHFSVQSGRENVATIKRKIKRSLGTAIRGLDNEITIVENRVANLDSMLQKNEARLSNVSKNRVPYSRKTRELEKLNDDYSESTARLSRMRSRKMASSSIKLLTRIGEPWIGTKADGMGRRMMSLIGAIAGLMIGLGLLMMIAPPFSDIDPEQLSAAQPEPVAQPEPAAPVTEQVSVAEQIPVEQPVPVPTSPSGQHRLEGLVPQRSKELAESVETVPQAEQTAVPDYVAETFEDATVQQDALAETEIVVDREIMTQQPETVESSQNQIQYALAGMGAAGIGAAAAGIGAATDSIPGVDLGAIQETVSDAIPDSIADAIPEGFSDAIPDSISDAIPEGFSSAIPESISDAVQDTVSGVSSQFEPAALPQSTYEQNVDVPPVVIVPTDEVAPVAEVPPVVVIPTPEPPAVEPLVTMAPPEPQAAPPSPGATSSTIAAIFANMPQPIVDVAEPEESSEPVEETPETRDSLQTIQLLGGFKKGNVIPLQRRTNVRPVDLAKSEEETKDATNQKSIDNVFSDLNPQTEIDQSIDS